MGKRSGITKSGRVMNPADRERKQMRQKELKRNKKQRVMVRHAIVKSRSPEDLIEQMRRMDEQEFDPDREISLNVINEKRSKIRGAFIQIIGLYRQEKEDKKVKSLEKMLHEYEAERYKMEQSFTAMEFSETVDPQEIPLPSGLMEPDASQTPCYAVPVPSIVPSLPTKSGILKKPAQIGPSAPVKRHKYPPGPPCGPPPLSLEENVNNGSDDDEGMDTEKQSSRRRVRFDEEQDDDLAPVEMPEGMLSNMPPPQSGYYMGGGSHNQGYSHPMTHPPHVSGPGPYPPGFQIPQNMAPEVHAQMLRTGRVPLPQHHLRPGGQEPHPSAVISAEPQVVKPSVDIPTPTNPVISAGPQMRNLKREATRFVPSALQVNRPQPASIGPKILPGGGPKTIVHKKANPRPQKAVKSRTVDVDKVCDDFLKELEGLI